MTGNVVVRELVADDFAEASVLGAVTFDDARGAVPELGRQDPSEVTRYGAFDGNGRLLGKITDLHHDQWWGGSPVAATDIAGVAVIHEARGRGVAHALLRHVLEQAKERGAAVSALFPTVATVYRSAGWTMVGARRTIDLSTSLLSGRRGDEDLLVRPGDPGDLAILTDLYEQMARSRNGLLSRRTSHFVHQAEGFPEGIDGVTVVEDGSGPVAGAAWGRGGGYRAEGLLRVVDLVGIRSDAVRALLRVLASWQPVAPTTRFFGVPSGIAGRELPLEAARPFKTEWWMSRPVDVVRLVTALRWPEAVKASVRFTLVDNLAPWNAGTWQLEIAGGCATLEPTTTAGAPSLNIEGFASLVCGTASPALLVESGLAASDLSDDLGLLAANPQPELLNYF